MIRDALKFSSIDEKHTPGKLVQAGLDTKTSLYMREVRDENNCLVAFSGSLPAEQAHANARRLVACWNACDGISTDALERVANSGQNMATAATNEAELLATIAIIEAAIAKLKSGAA